MRPERRVYDGIARAPRGDDMEVRQYMFVPLAGTVFNHECLAEIGGVIVFLRDRREEETC